jgi:hypothetical protein
MIRKIMKAVLFILIAVVGLTAAYVIFNQLDARSDPEREYTAADLAKNDFSAANGYYLLWALAEAPDVDIESAAVRQKYRTLFDPELGGSGWKNWNQDVYKKMYGHFYRLRSQLGKKHGIYPVSESPDQITVDWLTWAVKREAYLRELAITWEVLLRRYDMLQAVPVFQEFMPPAYDAPIPNLLAWLHVAKLFDNLCLLQAHDGDWSGAASRLLNHLAFSRRAMAGSRVLITRLIAEGIYRLNLQALASLLNQPECPVEVCELISRRLPDLSTEEIDLRQPVINEYLVTKDALQSGKIFWFEKESPIDWPRFLLQKNRTLRIWHDWGERLLRLEKTPPCRWESGAMELLTFRPGRLWWLQNPTGKKLAGAGMVSGAGLLHKRWLSRTLFDLLRISAELHQRYDFSRPVAQVLPTLASYRSVDPGSGKPYIWNDSKQILYGVGMDCVDNGGKELVADWKGFDSVLPCVLYVRPAR